MVNGGHGKPFPTRGGERESIRRPRKATVLGRGVESRPVTLPENTSNIPKDGERRAREANSYPRRRARKHSKAPKGY